MSTTRTPQFKLCHAIGIAILMAASTMPAALAHAQPCPLPDPNLSFFVPQTGPVTMPTEGPGAIRFLRACPNNDGGASLPNNVRIKVVLRDAGGAPLTGVSPDQIYTLFNSGTAAQGFFGMGADSVISNGTWNPAPSCPDVTFMKADAPTDASGTTYITFGGASAPGVYSRDSSIKWGHFDEEIPVFVGRPPCNPIRLKGRLTTGSPPGTYSLRIKNFDVVGGLGAVLNQGERVAIADMNTCINCLTSPAGVWCYWCDFDWSGAVNITDVNAISTHSGHSCEVPFSP
jgi:hypothetical protein